MSLNFTKTNTQIISTQLVLRKPPINLRRYRFMYFLLAPAMILTFIFNYLPMLGIVMAFQDFDIFKGFVGSDFIGLDNFIKIFSVPRFTEAILNTFVFSSAILFFSFPLPIILALLFNELRSLSFKRVVQTITYLPYFLSWISVITMFYAFFAIDGTFNDIRVYFFGADFERSNILMDPNNFLGILLGSHIWKTLGWSSVIFMAAIMGIDSTLYEAAIVDGCGRWKQILHITLPGIIPTVMIIFIFSTAGLATANFEQVYGFQNLYTQTDTEVINTLVFREGIQNGNYSVSTAFGLAQGLVSFLIIFVVNRISKRFSGISIW